MTGAEKIIDAMKHVSKSDRQVPSEITTATVISINPLMFQLENRLQISSEFYVLSNLFNWSKVAINQVFRALTFNEGQKYYILEPYPLNNNTNAGIMDERIATNRTDINNLTNTVSSISNQIVVINSAINSINSEIAPIGSGMDYFGTTAPENYMFADGSEISRTEYAELFTIIGTTYGSGDGSTTFNLPDKRERVSVMYKENSTNGTSGATLGTMGAKGGEFKHTISETELTAHYHGYDANILGSYWSSPLGYLSSSGSVSVGRINENPEQQTSWKGNSTSMNIMQPYLVCNYIIKVK